jgi:hypothetical protein
MRGYLRGVSWSLVTQFVAIAVFAATWSTKPGDIVLFVVAP